MREGEREREIEGEREGEIEREREKLTFYYLYPKKYHQIFM